MKSRRQSLARQERRSRNGNRIKFLSNDDAEKVFLEYKDKLEREFARNVRESWISLHKSTKDYINKCKEIMKEGKKMNPEEQKIYEEGFNDALEKATEWLNKNMGVAIVFDDRGMCGSHIFDVDVRIFHGYGFIVPKAKEIKSWLSNCMKNYALGKELPTLKEKYECFYNDYKATDITNISVKKLIKEEEYIFDLWK